jgi:16S rRNA (guanine1207-N2)-methyltransferase
VPDRAPGAAGYREWQTSAVTVAGARYRVATKPGVFAHGRPDPASVLLSTHAVLGAGDIVVQMSCGNGLFGAVAGRTAREVVLTDRNVLSVEAARRTLAANDVRNGRVLLAHGVSGIPSMTANVVAIRIPQERLALLQLLRDAFTILAVGGRCYIAGGTNEGIKPAARTLERLFGNVAVLAHQSGHRVAVATKRSASVASPEELTNPYLDPEVFNELDVTLRGHRFRVFTRPGVFSWDHVDEATTILADAMEIRPADSVLDLGCGCGVLGVVAGLLAERGRIALVDADVEAVRCAARSVAAAGIRDVRVLPSDVASAVINERFDVVVTNPPFHVGKATDLNVPLQFIQEAWEVLSPDGRLFLVANRTLPYERAIVQRFGNITTLHDGRRFKVLAATKAR